jgi:hypothetical protein
LARDADAAAFGNAFKAGGNVDAVAVDVIAFDDDVANVHADAKRHLATISSAGIARGHGALNLGGTIDTLNGAGKFGKQAIAHQLDDAAAMLGDAGIDDFRAMLLQKRERSRLVLAHHPAIADRVCGQDRG